MSQVSSPSAAVTQVVGRHFVIVDLQQGTPEWREWRHRGLGASEAPIIMGQSRFKTASQLLREKRGPVQDHAPNAAMALGTSLEPDARQQYIRRIGRQVYPVCVQSCQYPWMRASLDGYCPRTPAVVEIKCGRSAYWSTVKRRQVPELYYGQTQQIMAVLNLPSLDFYCYWPGFTDVLITVQRDGSYIAQLVSKGREFWKAVQTPQHSHDVLS